MKEHPWWEYHLFVIFAVLDVSLAVNLCINCSFFYIYICSFITFLTYYSKIAFLDCLHKSFVLTMWWTKQGGICRQNQWGEDDRGAKGALAPRGVGCGEGVSPSHQGRGLAMPPPQKIFWFWLSKWWVLVHSGCFSYSSTTSFFYSQNQCNLAPPHIFFAIFRCKKDLVHCQGYVPLTLDVMRVAFKVPLAFHTPL